MKSINHQAPVKCSRSININTRPERVWELLTNINDWASWQPEITFSKLYDGLKPGAGFEWKTQGFKIKSVLHTVETNKCFGWSGKSMGLYAIHNWTLVHRNGITELLVEESMEGFVARLMKKSLNKSLEIGMVNWLGFLKREAEKK